MTESTLCAQPSGQWAIAAPGREPVNIVASEVFLLEVLGERKLMRVRMEHADGKWYAVFISGSGHAAPNCVMGWGPGSLASASGPRGS